MVRMEQEEPCSVLVMDGKEILARIEPDGAVHYFDIEGNGELTFKMALDQ